LRYVQGMKATAAERLIRARDERMFDSVTDLQRRTQLEARELDTLAELGAFAALGKTRRQALWQVTGLAAQSVGLLGRLPEPEESSPLAEMSLPERIHADFKNSAMSVGPHPMAFAREGLMAQGILSGAELQRVGDGAWAEVAGLVRVRQRPGTAKGLFFITLEDETGFANLIVLPELFEAERAVILGSGGLVARGRVQNKEGVVHLRCEQVEDLAQVLPEAPLTGMHEAWASRYG
jgi:error-prone DNA polymerase